MVRLISAFQAVFGSLFHATRNFRRKNYFNKVTRALCQNKFLTNLFPSSRHSEQSKESLKKIAKPHDCIPFNTGKILRKTGHFSQNQRFLEKVVKQVQDDMSNSQNKFKMTVLHDTSLKIRTYPLLPSNNELILKIFVSLCHVSYGSVV